VVQLKEIQFENKERIKYWFKTLVITWYLQDWWWASQT